jgi:hypothetical protein
MARRDIRIRGIAGCADGFMLLMGSRMRSLKVCVLFLFLNCRLAIAATNGLLSLALR